MAERQGSVETVVRENMLDFFKNKRVFVTGHTGFKGTWLCTILIMAGADVTGFSLPPDKEESLFTLSGIESQMTSVLGDIRDYGKLKSAFDQTQPEVVIHMAAQPLVREGYRDPVGTYAVNVMGTVHLLECMRQSDGVRSFLNVTTDKVYQNNQWPWGYREQDILNGFDPYANSKSCSELVTSSYCKSFFGNRNTAVSTARAGNVIGGGDFAADRIIPDCIRAARDGKPIQLRNPKSVRPYQHVLDPLSAYLLIVQRQYGNPDVAGCYNVGPESGDCVTTSALADMFCKSWGNNLSWECISDSGPHEDAILRLDCSKMHSMLGWHPQWNIRQAVAETVDWTKKWIDGESPLDCMRQQIERFFKCSLTKNGENVNG